MKFTKPRIYLVGGLILFLYSVLIFNLYNIQIKKSEYYIERAKAQFSFSKILKPDRGTIYFTDKNGSKIPAVVGKAYPVIFAVPKEIDDPQETSAMLHEILGLDGDSLINRFKNPKDFYVRLVPKADNSVVQKIKEAGLKGVYATEENYRYYPFGALGSHLLGFVGFGEDGKEIGRYGIEKFYESSLAGLVGSLRGDQIEGGSPGVNISLTIARNIQARAEEILASLVQDHKAVGGTIIVEEPITGKILSMASYPTFDPNNYANFNYATFLNPAQSAIYEPGSVFKILTMASALDAGSIKPDTKFYDTGELQLNGKTIKNWDLKAHGSVTMTEVIEESINTGAAFAEHQLGHDNFYKYLLKFGFGELTGINLPGEIKGSLRTLIKPAQDINFATVSFGQGVSVTPIALINAMTSIANGGFLMRPYATNDVAPKIIRRVISKEAGLAVTRMMVSAVDKAKIAVIPQYEVAGKTGTAQVPDFKKGGYTDEVINTYVGYAPAFDPRFIILVKLDKPYGAPLAGTTVVPAFRELAQFIINYYNISPDRGR